MRTIALLLLIPLGACAAADAEDPVFIDDFAEVATTVRCEPLPSLNARRSTIGALHTVSDTSFLVLYESDREVAVIGPDLEPLHLISIVGGPDSTPINLPSGAALLGDSLLFVADQTGRRLIAFDLEGSIQEVITLDFPPQGLWQNGRDLLITPFVIGGHPRALLYALEEGRVRGLPIPTARYNDGMVNALANSANLATFPDGRVVLTHALIIPFARVLDHYDSAPTTVPLPLPDGVRDRFGWLPASQMTEADGSKLLFVTIASAPDVLTGDLVYLTKTGRSNEHGGEKAILRVDHQLRFLRAYTLDVNATRMAYLARAGVSLVTNVEDEWFSCPTP